jgi:hypothetical protein
VLRDMRRRVRRAGTPSSTCRGASEGWLGRAALRPRADGNVGHWERASSDTADLDGSARRKARAHGVSAHPWGYRALRSLGRIAMTRCNGCGTNLGPDWGHSTRTTVTHRDDRHLLRPRFPFASLLITLRSALGLTALNQRVECSSHSRPT